eukprot:scaffold3801_cov75-Attheya_sp.AAC.5
METNLALPALLSELEKANLSRDPIVEFSCQNIPQSAQHLWNYDAKYHQYCSKRGSSGFKNHMEKKSYPRNHTFKLESPQLSPVDF